jgi:hypothetical protein
VGPRADPDAVEYGKMSCPCEKSNPGYPFRSPSQCLLNYKVQTGFKKGKLWRRKSFCPKEEGGRRKEECKIIPLNLQGSSY